VNLDFIFGKVFLPNKVIKLFERPIHNDVQVGANMQDGDHDTSPPDEVLGLRVRHKVGVDNHWVDREHNRNFVEDFDQICHPGVHRPEPRQVNQDCSLAVQQKRDVHEDLVGHEDHHQAEQHASQDEDEGVPNKAFAFSREAFVCCSEASLEVLFGQLVEVAAQENEEPEGENVNDECDRQGSQGGEPIA